MNFKPALLHNSIYSIKFAWFNKSIQSDDNGFQWIKAMSHFMLIGSDYMALYITLLNCMWNVRQHYEYGMELSH